MSESGKKYVVPNIARALKILEHLAKEKLRGVVEMAGAVAHEFNTPVFAALGATQLLMDDLSASDPLFKEIETIATHLKNISTLTRKMTRITTYEAKKYVGDVKIFDIDKASQGSDP